MNLRGPGGGGGIERYQGGRGPGRGYHVLSYILVFVFLIVSTVSSAVLLALPPEPPNDIFGWASFALGSVLGLFTSIAVPQARKLSARLARLIHESPTEIRTLSGWKVLTGVAAIAAIVLIVNLISPLPASQELEPGNIYVISAFDQSPQDPRRILIDEWNQSHPNNQVFTIDAPGGTDQQHERFVKDAVPGGEHAADLYALDDVWMAEFIDKGYIRAVNQSPARDENFIPNVLETAKDPTGRHPGLWGLPLNTDAGLIFFRPDLVGPKSSIGWDDYSGASARQAYQGVKSASSGDSASTLRAADAGQLAGNDEILTVTAFEAIWAAGGELVNRQGIPAVDASGQIVLDDRTLAGIKNLSAVARDRSIMLPESGTTESEKAIGQFHGGSALFMRNWPLAYDKLAKLPGAPLPQLGALAPRDSTVLGGQDLAIPSGTKKPKAAQAFAEYMASPASQRTLFDLGGFAPTRFSAYDLASPLTRPYAQQLKTAVINARPRPYITCYTKFSGEFRNGITQALGNIDGSPGQDFATRLTNALNC